MATHLICLHLCEQKQHRPSEHRSLLFGGQGPSCHPETAPTNCVRATPRSCARLCATWLGVEDTGAV